MARPLHVSRTGCIGRAHGPKLSGPVETAQWEVPSCCAPRQAALGRSIRRQGLPVPIVSIRGACIPHAQNRNAPVLMFDRIDRLQQGRITQGRFPNDVGIGVNPLNPCLRLVGRRAVGGTQAEQISVCKLNQAHASVILLTAPNAHLHCIDLGQRAEGTSEQNQQRQNTLHPTQWDSAINSSWIA